MVKSLPYVYKLIHKETNKFYFGSRWANCLPADLDLGKKYFTSSKEIKINFHEYNYEIIKQFDNKQEAFIFEQNLIKNNWNNPLLLNKGCFGINGKMILNVTSSHKSEIHKQKLSEAAKKRSPEWKEKQSKVQSGKKLSEETKKKMSLAKKGKYDGENNPMYGKTLSLEQKQKISQSVKKTLEEKKHG